MRTKKKHYLIDFTTFFIFFLFFILHSTDNINISIKNATPMLLLPILTAFSIFNSAISSAFTGLVIGVCIDGIATNSFCYNAIILLFCAVFVSVSSDHLFNKNIYASIMLSFITSFEYFLSRWLIFFAFKATVQDNFIYVLKFAIPSIIYTSIFIIPFFYLFKHLKKLKTE